MQGELMFVMPKVAPLLFWASSNTACPRP